jgi:hypothetical protein
MASDQGTSLSGAFVRLSNSQKSQNLIQKFTLVLSSSPLPLRIAIFALYSAEFSLRSCRANTTTRTLCTATSNGVAMALDGKDTEIGRPEKVSRCSKFEI